LSSKAFDNIIFDLGGVIINLDIEATFQKFSELFGKTITADAFVDHEKHRFFRDYEVGIISSDTFRNHIRTMTDRNIEDAAIDDAWNAMLKDIPKNRISWIYDATKKYNCVVLSNTNSIHVKHFEQIFNSTTPYGFPKGVFQKLFYSFEIGARKPDAKSFEILLNETGFDPARTVLFDDLKENLQTAKRLGIQTVYVERNNLRENQLLKLDGRA